jgi:hypothetical protein
LISTEIPKKSIKLKPPSVQTSHKNNRMGGDAKKYFKKIKADNTIALCGMEQYRS